VVGVSPGVQVYSLKVLNGLGAGSLSSILGAVKWVATEGVKQGIKVINLSLVTKIDPASPMYSAFRDSICAYFTEASNAGVVVVAAAGVWARA
jgi:subtilisin family serine protease